MRTCKIWNGERGLHDIHDYHQNEKRGFPQQHGLQDRVKNPCPIRLENKDNLTLNSKIIKASRTCAHGGLEFN